MGYRYVKFTSAGADKKFNEDSLEVIEMQDGLLCLLCDGVGGEYGGDLAARIALKSAMYFFSSFDSKDYIERIKYAIEEANAFLFNHSLNTVSEKNMATTIELMFFTESFIYWAHIGDSRIYHLRSQRLHLLTKDHSMVQKLLDEGFISRSQAKNHPQRNVIINALGEYQHTQPDISKIKVNDFETNKFFICSDGVSNIVSNKELEEILNYADLEQMKIQIVKLIKQRGAPDDYSFIILEKFK